MMMNRRQFVSSTAASAAMLAGIPNAFAQSYELIIKGGRVIDPSIGLDATRDVAIAGGKIAAVEANITAAAADTIDARGKIVAPGLIDIHTHAGRSKEGPPMCLEDGVTGWVDAGSGGAENPATTIGKAGWAAVSPVSLVPARCRPLPQIHVVHADCLGRHRLLPRSRSSR
jgi:dihydroorotase